MWGEKSVGKTRHLFVYFLLLKWYFNEVELLELYFNVSVYSYKLSINFHLGGRESNDSSTQTEMFNETESRKIVKFPLLLLGETLKY